MKRSLVVLLFLTLSAPAAADAKPPPLQPPIWLEGGEPKPGGLFDAAERGDLDKVKQVLASGVKPDADRDKWGTTPLMRAAYRGHVEIMKLLMDRGADVNAECRDGASPLQSAGDGGHLETAVLLVDRGADVRHKDHAGRTPLYNAVEFGGSNGQTVGGGSIAIAKLLVDKGADVNAALADGDTPIFSAACRGNKRIAEFLIGKGADVNVTDEFGHTPLRLVRIRAKRTGRAEFKAVADLLVAHGAREGAPDTLPTTKHASRP